MDRGQTIYNENPDLQPLQQVAHEANPHPLQQSAQSS